MHKMLALLLPVCVAAAPIPCPEVPRCDGVRDISGKVEKVAYLPADWIAMSIPAANKLRLHDDEAKSWEFPVLSPVFDMQVVGTDLLAVSFPSRGVETFNISSFLWSPLSSITNVHLGVSPDAKWLALGSASAGGVAHVTIVDIANTGAEDIRIEMTKPSGEVVPGYVDDVTFSPDGRFMAFTNSPLQKVAVVKTSDWTMELLDDAAFAVRFTADSAHLITIAKTGLVRSYEVGGNGVPTTVFEAGGIAGVECSVDMARCATVFAGGAEFAVWDMATGEQEELLAGHEGSLVATVAWESQTSLMACNYNEQCLSYTLPPKATESPPTTAIPTAIPATPPLDCPTPDTMRTPCNVPGCAFKVEHLNTLRSVAYSPDGTLIASGSDDGKVRLFDVYGTQLRHIPCIYFVAHDLAFSPDSTHIVAGGPSGKLVVCDHVSGVVIDHSSDVPLAVSRVAFSSDGSMVSAGGGTSVSRYLPDGSVGTILQGFARDAVFDTSGASIATAGSGVEDPVRVWNSENGAKLAELPVHLGDVQALAFTADGELARGYSNGEVLIGGDDGSVRLTLALPSTFLYDIAISQDGTMLAAAGLQHICVWNTTSGTLLHTFAGHPIAVVRVAFSPDNTHLATAGTDHSLYVWSL